MMIPRTNVWLPELPPVDGTLPVTVDTPFHVTEGLVVVEGRHNLTLLPGATWPGLGALPAPIATSVMSGDLRAATGTRLRPATPAEITAGIALATSQALRSLPGAEAYATLTALTGHAHTPRDAMYILDISHETAMRALKRHQEVTRG
ncbi:hypothetical protein [Deinococcus seoulensis]|nr:hypothetical protein [Deinococcus seoulensis]